MNRRHDTRGRCGHTSHDTRGRCGHTRHDTRVRCRARRRHDTRRGHDRTRVCVTRACLGGDRAFPRRVVATQSRRARSPWGPPVCHKPRACHRWLTPCNRRYYFGRRGRGRSRGRHRKCRRAWGCGRVCRAHIRGHGFDPRQFECFLICPFYRGRSLRLCSAHFEACTYLGIVLG